MTFGNHIIILFVVWHKWQSYFHNHYTIYDILKHSCMAKRLSSGSGRPSRPLGWELYVSILYSFLYTLSTVMLHSCHLHNPCMNDTKTRADKHQPVNDLQSFFFHRRKNTFPHFWFIFPYEHVWFLYIDLKSAWHDAETSIQTNTKYLQRNLASLNRIQTGSVKLGMTDSWQDAQGSKAVYEPSHLIRFCDDHEPAHTQCQSSSRAVFTSGRRLTGVPLGIAKLWELTAVEVNNVFK